MTNGRQGGVKANMTCVSCVCNVAMTHQLKKYRLCSQAKNVMCCLREREGEGEETDRQTDR